MTDHYTYTGMTATGLQVLADVWPDGAQLAFRDPLLGGSWGPPTYLDPAATQLFEGLTDSGDGLRLEVGAGHSVLWTSAGNREDWSAPVRLTEDVIA